MEEPIIIILSLLTISVIILVFVVVWRDRRDLKLNQVAKEVKHLEDLLQEIQHTKQEIEEMLVKAKKQTDQAVSKVDNQMKQVRASVANLEQRIRDSGRDKNKQQKHSQQKFSGKGKSRTNNPREKGESHPKNNKNNPKIDDGEKYAKMVELAKQGLSKEEIAKRLNLGCKEVDVVLKLKQKNIS